MTALSNLIESASRANRGRSMQAAADLATQKGCPISKSHISKNAKSVESITPQVVRGIAAGYGLDEEEVVRAALADLGFAIMDYNPSPESALRRDPNLSMEARAMLLAALQAARDSLLASGAGRAGRPVVGGVTDERENPIPDVFFRRTDASDPGEAGGEDRRQQGR